MQNEKEEIKQNPSQDQTNNYNIIFTKNTNDNKLLSNNKTLKMYKIILVFRNENF